MPTLGAIADDFTGATDLATNLVSRGYRTVVRTGLPAPDDPGLAQDADADAVVIALQSRTAPPGRAVADSLAALAVLRELGCERFYFKYCSTFDSTPTGNIGPVLDALMHAVGASVTLAVPSLPGNGRTVYQGHLFVHRQLLSESPMRHHPLTPMTESDVVGLLAAQSGHETVLTDHATVRSGAAAVRRALEADPGRSRIHVVDAVDDADLAVIADGASGLTLWSGGSGLALGLPVAGRPSRARDIPVAEGFQAVLAGSASAATRRQVARGRERMPARKLDLAALRADLPGEVADLARWAAHQWAQRPGDPVLVYAVASLDDIEHDTSPGLEPASALVERALGRCAQELLARGARRFLIAGGETSGTVTTALDVTRLRIGPAIAPGVAWASATAGPAGTGPVVNLALKSGNFGDDSVFTTAWKELG
ncbi:3-oxo-tetronate kinase [Streptomyces sp. NPDC059398]|uniref:3-oxo-tetronate kinase n=1 Tax=Streptomyces sp. NPDC059398 TaxID=3346820 RepID=UPI0036C3C990